MRSQARALPRAPPSAYESLPLQSQPPSPNTVTVLPSRRAGAGWYWRDRRNLRLHPLSAVNQPSLRLAASVGRTTQNRHLQLRHDPRRRLQTVFGGWDLQRDLARFIERDDCRLYKLHGSVAWSRAVRAQAEPYSMMVDSALTHAESGGRFDGDIRRERGPLQVQDSPEIWVPAIAVPMEAKTDFECPPSHLQALREDLPSVRRVLIVGWRAAEPHVVKLLHGSDAQPGLMPGSRP